MDLRVALSGVAEHEYSHEHGRHQPAQQHLQHVRRTLPDLVPAGMRVLVSGSGQNLPVVPWISILNLEVTTTAQEGIYIVYLYRRDLSRVYLSMNQGATQHKNNAESDGLRGLRAKAAALKELDHEASLIRDRISTATQNGLLESIDLAPGDYFLPRGYEAGNILAVEYKTSDLPREEALQEDLSTFLALYSKCVDIKNDILATEPGRMQTAATSTKTTYTMFAKSSIFRPKNSADYLAKIQEQVQQKGRRHEDLLKQFASWVTANGLTPANNVHPRDLTVDTAHTHWLVEAKTVNANAEQSARDAIGQLFSYRHFYYRNQGYPDPALVALFSEPIGEALSELVNSLGIECIWQSAGRWTGSASTNHASLLKAVAADTRRN